MPIKILNKEYKKCCICGHALPTDKDINVTEIFWSPKYCISVAHDKCKELLDKISDLQEQLTNAEWELFLLKHPYKDNSNE